MSFDKAAIIDVGKLFPVAHQKVLANRGKETCLRQDETVGYLNHSCEPNSFLDFSCLCVRALRDIQRGEEVKVNYAVTEYEMHDSFRCDWSRRHAFR
jgi:SET domain-containing protein